ncbi:DUF4912 domain-containing protein [filamentous cyanobacterium LEGE 11480]|uniref:DUF4912 domain-containing protein n=1 Tax=Romeriopsis navalis LEGE 11480 TaxID=2777977 RepID=A0A928VHF7_9CYAN|nr:DUF4912 domain-containing protein [Romeriopsis navalis]MBE9028678.1 DUF4912 domain-containing protein [Romeriopsis navalis LEGE 11480]
MPLKSSPRLQFSLVLALAGLAIPVGLIAPSSVQAVSEPEVKTSPAVTAPLKVRIDGSGSMAGINATLQETFAKQNPNGQVVAQVNGTTAGLQALRDGKVDLAAIGRDLTEAETAEGLVAIPIKREKIAMLVGDYNAYDGNTTIDQFANMFRGVITNWSEIEEKLDVPVRFIDHPEDSDTRLALSRYAAFRSSAFENGVTTERLPDEKTESLVKALGNDGISYLVISQARNLPGTRILFMHKTLPDNPNYPFSQGFSYVYRRGQLTPAAKAFLKSLNQPEAIETLRYSTVPGVDILLPNDPAINAALADQPGVTAVPSTDAAAAATSTTAVKAGTDAGGVYSNHPQPDAAPWWWLLPVAAGVAAVVAFKAKRGAGGVVPPGSIDASTAVGKVTPIAASGKSTVMVPSTPNAPTAPASDLTPPNGGTAMAPPPETGAANLSDPPSGAAGQLNLPGVGVVAAGGAALGGLTGDQIADQATDPNAIDGNEVAAADASAVVDAATVSEHAADDRDTADTAVPGQLKMPGLGGLAAGAAGVAAAGVAVGAGILGQEKTSDKPADAEQDSSSTSGPDSSALDAPDATTPVAPVESTVVPAAMTPDDRANDPAAKQTPPVTAPDVAAADPTIVSAQMDNRPLGIGGLAAGAAGIAAAGVAAGAGMLGRKTDQNANAADSANANAAEPDPAMADDTATERRMEFPGAAIDNPSVDDHGVAGRRLDSDVSTAGTVLPDADIATDGTTFQPITQLPADTQSPMPTEESDIPFGQGHDAATVDRADRQATLPRLRDMTTDTSVSDVSAPDDTSGSVAVATATSEPNGAGAAIAGFGVAGLGAAALRSSAQQQAGEQSDSLSQTNVEATKYDVGQADPATAASRFSSTDMNAAALADVDDDLPDLPDGYGDPRIVLIPRDPQWAYAYWDVPEEMRRPLRAQGGKQLALRLYDVTDVQDNNYQPHSMVQHAVDELAQNWYLEIPVSDRDYLVELGYVADADEWLSLVRSNSVRIPPVYPSDWVDDQMVSIDWDESLQGRKFGNLEIAAQPAAATLHETMFDLSQPSMTAPGSQFGSMPMAQAGALSSYIFPSGVGQWAMPTESGVNMSGMGWFSGTLPASRQRQFWLVADAELIVYGATEPDATVTIAGEPIRLSPDGTFRLQMSFQDGQLDFPIMAVATDGEQMRQVHLRFERQTPLRETNTKAEAQPEDLD